jgi:hypothetical protein
MVSASAKNIAIWLFAVASVAVAIGCVVAAVSEGNAGTFDRPFAIHTILLWLWIVVTAGAILLSRFRWYYFLLLLLTPVAVAPIPTWMFILFRVLHVQFAP